MHPTTIHANGGLCGGMYATHCCSFEAAACTEARRTQDAELSSTCAFNAVLQACYTSRQGKGYMLYKATEDSALWRKLCS